MKIKPRDFCLAQAAMQLGISRPVLVRELLARGMVRHDLHGNLVPVEQYVALGLLGSDLRTHYVNGAIAKHYQVTKVTLRGLARIADLLAQELPASA